MKRVLLILLCALALPLAAQAAGPTQSQSQELATIEQQTERIRQLTPRHPVSAQFPSAGAFQADVKAEMLRDNPDSEIALSQREWVVLGLLAKSDSLKRSLVQGIGSEVAGFYDSHRKVLYVSPSGAFGPQRWVIAHEFTHALQDQHWNLQKILPDESKITYRNSDQLEAHRDLTEGDAVNLQYLFVYRTYSAKDLTALADFQAHLTTPRLPKAVQREFDFAYDQGYAFVRRLYRQGGMAAVDAAYSRLPSSTYEIMYPSAYLQHWKPAKVTLHGVHALTGWQQVDDDVLGAFGYHLLLWQYLSLKRADQVTSGYRGDRYLFLENGQQSAMLLKSVWQNAKAARSARGAVLAMLRARYRQAQTTAGGTLVLDRDGAVYVQTAGKQLTIAYAPDQADAQALGTAATD